MKNLTLFIVLACFIQSTATSQSCLPQGIRFISQEQINNFQHDYPNCTKIEGTVSFNGEDIINVNGLQNLTAIEGNLFIDGFTNRVPSLTSLKGFKNLKSIGGSFRVSQTLSLADLTGLEKLTSIGGQLMIGVIGFKSTNSTDGNCALKSLAGLDNLSSVGKGVCIGHNKSLESLKGLENLTSVGGDLVIDRNKKIKDLDALQNLTFVDGNIKIIQNLNLENIDGISNINPENIQDLKISNNPLLAFCETNSFCTFLEELEGDILISKNAEGCNNDEEVMKACGHTTPNNAEFSADIFSSHPNPFTSFTTITFVLELPTTIQLKISNYLGKQIQVDEFSLAEGKHEIIWDASSLPSGIYICTLKTDNYLKSLKMMKKR